MSVIKIRKAKRAGARLVVGIAGISGSGKTFTGLQLAYGLAGYDASKVGFLDTENRRGSLYADALRDANGAIQEFYIGDLEPPFSPQRYIEAILEFQKAGVEVLVVDTVTHEWEGQGGCHDIAAAAGNGRGKNWLKGKEEHKRFMNVLLQCDMHIIVCIRARQKVEVVQEGNKQVFKPLGIMPIQEENFMFEMTASLMMHAEGKQQEVMKCPAELQPILGREEGYITPADGKALRDWVLGAEQLNPDVERAKATLKTTCEKGLAALQIAWGELPAKLRKAISPTGCPEEYKAAAVAFDDQRRLAAGGSQELDDLNADIKGAEA